MAAEIITACIVGGNVIIEINLDTDATYTDAEGVDQPAHARRYVWGVPPREGKETDGAYQKRVAAFADSCVREAKLLAATEPGFAAAAASPVDLAARGEVF